MKCISPYTFKKEGRMYTVSCNRCAFCLEERKQEWTFRLVEEYKDARTADFVTLTYNEENNTGSLSKSDIQLFLKRLRKESTKMDKQYLKDKKVEPTPSEMPSIRYYLVGEYSPVGRPHYHAIMFNINRKVQYNLARYWKKGNVHIGKVNKKTIQYTLKYILDKDMHLDTPEGITKPFAMMSRNPGLGRKYLNRNGTMHKNQRKDVVINDGIKQKLPRYFKDKTFNQHEKDLINSKKKAYAEKKEIEKLNSVKHYPEPHAYLEEQRNKRHELIKRNNRKNRKL